MANEQNKAAAATAAAGLIMSDDDLRKCYQLIADEMTPDTTAEMYCEILADMSQRDPEFDKATPYGKLLFAAREMYLYGITYAFTMYRDVIKMSVGEKV